MAQKHSLRLKVAIVSFVDISVGIPVVEWCVSRLPIVLLSLSAVGIIRRNVSTLRCDSAYCGILGKFRITKWTIPYKDDDNRLIGVKITVLHSIKCQQMGKEKPRPWMIVVSL